MEYEELRKALETFSLSGKATLKEIKERHRELVKCFHPDAGGGDPARIREINSAYRILSEYCLGYRFSLTWDEFLKQNPEERLRQQFAQDPIWGG